MSRLFKPAVPADELPAPSVNTDTLTTWNLSGAADWAGFREVTQAEIDAALPAAHYIGNIRETMRHLGTLAYIPAIAEVARLTGIPHDEVTGRAAALLERQELAGVLAATRPTSTLETAGMLATLLLTNGGNQ